MSMDLLVLDLHSRCYDEFGLKFAEPGLEHVTKKWPPEVLLCRKKELFECY